MLAQDSEIIQRLSHRPGYILDGVVTFGGWPRRRRTFISREAQSSLGQLDCFPLELLHECLKHLDLVSLQNLSRTCLQGNRAVNSLPQLKNVTKAAGYIFDILERAQLLRHHSIQTLHAALHSETCISCGLYGPFFHLLSAQRCCYLCLDFNQSLWMISRHAARVCFGLKKRDVRKLPCMWTLPGNYHLPRNSGSISRTKPRRRLSVMAVKELALKVHGSLEALERAQPLYALSVSRRRFKLWKYYRQAPSLPLSPKPCFPTYPGITPIDPYGGMGAVHFPSLSTGQIEEGHWCKACEDLYINYGFEDIDDDTLARLEAPEGCDTYEYLWTIRYRAWSASEFLQHAKHCHVADVQMEPNTILPLRRKIG